MKDIIEIDGIKYKRVEEDKTKSETLTELKRMTHEEFYNFLSSPSCWKGYFGILNKNSNGHYVFELQTSDYHGYNTLLLDQ